MMNEDEQRQVLAQVDELRRTDRRAWARLRRLVIVAECCQRSPLIEVWETDPPHVRMRQLKPGKVDPGDTERKPWSGSRQGKLGFEWLSTFERMVERGGMQVRYAS